MDPVLEKAQLLDEIENAGPRGPAPDSIRRYLRLVREQKTRESEPVARWGSLLLGKHKRALAEEELWLVYEQVALAAMDCQANSCAASCVNAVCREFPDTSIRAKRLKGMYFEATDNLERAVRLYDDILRDDPANELALKRKVAVQRTKGDLAGAAQALKSYLECYMVDRDAWEEMADIYLKMQHYKQAAFCYEELIMLAPNNLTYHLRFADVLCTLGGSNNFQTALSHYCHTIEASGGGCVRALFGVCVSLNGITAAQTSQDTEDIGKMAGQSLLRIYAQQSPDKLPFVKDLLKSQGLLE
ncbi:hypothetical protein BSKO_08307 [Bryopsis sp. KO-2023]|nr:hypothetical protein BSKO_08307 [Bryopsis sp. KO-2023]